MVLHSAARGTALWVGEAKLIETVVAAGPAVAVAPKVIEVTVGGA